MNFETVYEKIKYGTMTLCEFEDWNKEFDQMSYERGYGDGNRDGYDEAKEGYE